jgi:hypothetical protein
VVDTTSQVEVPYNSHRRPWEMGAAHPSDLDDRSTQGRNSDEAYTAQEVGDGDKLHSDFHMEVTTERC